MSKKGERVVFDSATNYGVGPYEDAKAKLKHQNLLQDYEELQRETDAMRSKLEAASKRKSILAAEVRFLRKRYKHLVKSKNMDSSQEQAHAQKISPPKKAKTPKESVFIRKGTSPSQHILALVPQLIKKKQFVVEPAVLISNSNQKDKKRMKKEAVAPNAALLYDKIQKERILCANEVGLRNPIATFDLNEDSCPNGKEASFPSRAPIFDLNEISTGDEDFGTNVEAVGFEESKKSLMRGLNDEQQNDMKLAFCRNSGEGSSRVGKRKISWQDPVALRV
ncbi:homeobox-leucine zipper protein family [Striga asiatica]|uniref:Homeobox-leucine zipper protein family n=1 Tax=Striga asiatica TaxID=4170 RepID=A0A5A7QNZ7_STRAF|nr:homeobox-leucine zipper protein family [Striga asiatica]